MKFKNVYALAIILFSQLVMGCIADPKKNGIVLGMDMNMVESIMGKPTRITKQTCVEGALSCLETWRYDGRNITFNNGIVDGF